MNNYFESILYEAMLRTEEYYIDINRNGFSKLYPFTTENIKGYIEKFNLTNKSLLTVGSSADQAINATLYDCKDITIIDICPFTKFYFYLKQSAILTLDYNNFLNFFCYKDFPQFCHNNKNAFNLEIYKTLKTTLRLLNYESYLFWDELFSNYQGLQIRKELFSHDEYRLEILKEINHYLHNEVIYYETREKLKKIIPIFINNNLFEPSLNRTYDNIWLSNIASYHSLIELKILVTKLFPYLNNNGKLLVSYLYETTKNTKYEDNWKEVYNLNKLLKDFQEVLPEYNLDLITFKGIKDIIFNSNNRNDSILVLNKRKNRS